MSRYFLRISFFVVVILLAGLALADPGPDGQRWTIHSAILGEDRVVTVHLPANYESSSGTYPVLYVLDGEQLYFQLSGVAENLSWGFRGPDIIVVAIHNVRRSRDFAVPWTFKTKPGPMSAGTAARAGGADRFVEFLEKELVPKVESTYRTAHFRMIFGHSLGGLFALHTFAATPGFFDATIASSPAIDYNGDYVVDRIKSAFADGKISKGYLFVSMAEREYDDSPRAFRVLDELLKLRAPRGLKWATQVMPGTDHGTVLLFAAQRGIESVFPTWRLPTFIFNEGIDSVEAFYRSMSAEYGMPILPPEREMAALIQVNSENSTAGQLLHVYERYAFLYPESITALSGFATELKKAGRKSEAQAALRKAVMVAERDHDDRSADLKSRLAGLGG